MGRYSLSRTRQGQNRKIAYGAVGNALSRWEEIQESFSPVFGCLVTPDADSARIAARAYSAILTSASRRAFGGRDERARPRSANPYPGGRDWDRRVDTLMRECKIDCTANMARLLTDVRKQGKIIEAWADGEPQKSPRQ
jgi:hypothetical protein